MGHERYKKKAGLVRRGQQSYLLEGSLLLLFHSWAAVKKKEETFNQCFRAKSFCVKLVLSYSGSRLLLSFASESDLWLDRVTIRRMDSVRGDLFLS